MAMMDTEESKVYQDHKVRQMDCHPAQVIIGALLKVRLPAILLHWNLKLMVKAFLAVFDLHACFLHQCNKVGGVEFLNAVLASQ